MNQLISENKALQWDIGPKDQIICSLCHHRCHINPGKTGRCGVRLHKDNILYAQTYGLISAEAIDPIEKKPLYHFLPGTYSYSLGSVSCNFSCAHCQNWHISTSSIQNARLRYLSPEKGVERALDNRCQSISWTYNEPTIWYEFTKDMGRIAKQQQLGTVYVTNGYMTEEALSDLAPYLDAWRVDIKAFSDDFYKNICKARLQPVLDATRKAHDLGLHIETVTLVIPGLNDSMEELGQLISWVIEELGVDTPMHFTRFHPDYQMTDRQPTPLKTLEKVYELAKARGLNYPYIGNVTGHPFEHTYCPVCKKRVIDRSGFSSSINLDGTACVHCGAEIAIIRRI